MGKIDKIYTDKIYTDKNYTESDIFILRMVYHFMMNNKDKSMDEIASYLNSQGISETQFQWALNENNL